MVLEIQVEFHIEIMYNNFTWPPKLAYKEIGESSHNRIKVGINELYRYGSCEIDLKFDCDQSKIY